MHIKRIDSKYRLSLLKDGQEIGGSALTFKNEKDFNEITDAITKGTQSLINTLKTWGQSASQAADILQESFNKENKNQHKPFY